MNETTLQNVGKTLGATPDIVDIVRRDQSLIAPVRAERAKKEKELGEFEGLKSSEELKRQKYLAEQEAEAIAGKRKTLEEAPETARLKEVEDRLMREGEFVPTRETAGDMAQLFAIINIAGFAMGAGGKRNAQAAMSGMNGMMEGYQKGRADLYKKEKDQFETNFKKLVQTQKSLREQLSDLAQRADLTVSEKTARARMTALQMQADFVAQHIDKVGLPRAIETLKEQEKSLERAIDIVRKEQERVRAKAEARELERIKHGYRMEEAKVKGKGTATSALLAGRAENIREAFAQAAKDIVNITRFPPGTMLGTFAGLTGASADSLTNGIRNAIARGVTEKEQRQLETLIAGIEGHLAFALGGGYASSMSKARMDQYKAQLARAGDDPSQVPLMLARFKQEMNILADNFASKPGATPEMNAAVQKYNENINNAIPFTVEDVLDASYAGAKPPTTAGPKTERPLPTPKTKEEFDALPPGSKYIDPDDGKTYRKPQR